MKRQTYIVVINVIASSPNEARKIIINHPNKYLLSADNTEIFTEEEWNEMFEED